MKSAGTTSERANDAFGSPVLLAPTLFPTPPVIPDHELLKSIGRGSYGDVWLARNVLGEYRAVKIVHRATFEDDRPFEREFEGIRRFEPISRSHPSQLNILHVGRGEDCFFYVMELADDVGAVSSSEFRVSSSPAPPTGNQRETQNSKPETYFPHTLKADLKRRGRLPPAECVEIGLALTTALAHLHAHGLVHRDIKPSNIIFVGGMPKLADIGLVADVDASRSFVGTDGFLPPEGPGTPQADLYSLGKVLYEMSTGRDRKDYPALPLDWDALDSAEQARLLELNEVLVKVCEADPRRRYQTAEQLGGDLRLLQRGQSVRRERVVQRRFGIAKRIAWTATGLAIVATLGYGWVKSFTSGGRAQKSSGQVRRTIDPRGTANQEAHDHYVEAWKHAKKSTRDGFTQAVFHFNRAIELDPEFAEAYVGLSWTYLIFSDGLFPPDQMMPEARKNAIKAIAIDETLGRAHTELGVVKYRYDWDWAGAEKELKRGLELAPMNAEAHAGYASFLRALGRLEEARGQQEQAQRLAPLDVGIVGGSIAQCCLEGELNQAVELCRELLARQPDDPSANFWLSFVYMRMGRPEKAVAQLQKLRASNDGVDSMGSLGYLFATTGKSAEARQLLVRLEDLEKTQYVPAYYKAMIHAGLGENEQVFQCLAKACQEHSNSLIGWGMNGLSTDPRWDALRSDPRFVKLLQRVGLR